MAKTCKPSSREATKPPVETAEEVSRMGELAGVLITPEHAAWVASKIAQRRAAAEAVRGMDYRRHEPANVFAPPRYE